MGKINFEQIKDVKVNVTEKEMVIVESVARRYAESMMKSECKDDIKQNLLEHLVVIKKYIKLKTGKDEDDNLAYVKAIMENKAKDMYRSNKRLRDREVVMNMSSSKLDVGEEQAETVLERLGCSEVLFEQKEYDEIETLNSIFKKLDESCNDEKLKERVKTVIIVSGYLNGKADYLEKAYYEIENKLDDEKKRRLYEFLGTKDKLVDSIVYEIFVGVRGNSGSASKIKYEMRKLFGIECA